MLSLLALGLGFFLDLLIGDPHWLPHPVRWMGWFIKKLEPPLRNIFPKSKNGEICAGTILVIVVIIVFTVLPFLLLVLCHWIHPILRLSVETVMCYQLLAVKSLKTESMKVYQKLNDGGLLGARHALSNLPYKSR